MPNRSLLPPVSVAESVRVVPANEASWEELQTVFGVRGYTATCQCQRFKVGPYQWNPMPLEERQFRLRVETACGHPRSETTSGLVAYLGDDPVGWCAVEPRSRYPRLLQPRIRLAERGESVDDDTVWAATCFVVRTGYRRRGITYALARAAVDFARARGARALEAYPMITQPGVEITWGETHVGTRNVFEAAGMKEILHPTPRRVVMRIDF